MRKLIHKNDMQPNRLGVSAFFLGGLCIVAGLTFFSSRALAQQPQVPAPAPQAGVPATQAVESPAQAPQAGAGPQSTQEAEAPQTLHLLVGRSLVITSPTRIKRVSLADPTIADEIVVSPNQVVVNGKAPGGVSLLIWDETGQSQNFEVYVDIDILGLSQKIHEVFPGEQVQIETSGSMVMLSGKISSAQVADKILEVVKGVTPKVTSLMEVPPVPTSEISLEVRFADVNRVAISELGANLLRTFGSNMPMAVSTQQFAPPTLGSLTTTQTTGATTTTSTSGQNNFQLSDLLNIFIYRPDINLAATIKALQENNLLEILAEPTLLTASGKEASFLAGGEFPYPILQGVGSGTAGGITIMFKEYGIRLNFLPTMTQDGRIHLKVEPEVSTLDFTNAITIQGFLLPALSTTRVTSEMDLSDGQSFAVAGLLDNRVTEQLEKVPGIGDIPILGKLFQSRMLNKSKNELLIVVTPHIVQPLATPPPGPSFPQPFMPSATPAEQKPAGK